ncbi:MAG: type VI secretion system Vgr family protein [Chitinophagales bacterium]|nr:type VI secretion system Vgr family protein [Chitinophagales bacterium]
MKIQINGSTPFKSFHYFSLSQSFDNHHRFEISTPLYEVEGDGASNFDKGKDFIGKPLVAELQDANDGKTSLQFNGVVTDVAVQRHSGAASELIIKGYSPTIVLEHGPNMRSFVDVSLSHVVKNITSKYPKNGINYKISPSPDPQIAFSMQYKESSFNYIARLANKYGQWFFFDGKDCIFGGLPSGNTIDMVFGDDLAEFNLGMKLQPAKFVMKEYDYINNKTYETKSPSVSNLDQLGKFALSESDSYYFDEQTYSANEVVASNNDVSDLAKARRSAIAGGLVILSGKSYNAKLKIGATIHVTGRQDEDNSSVDYGQFTVIRVKHLLKGAGTYYNTFEAIPSSVSIPLTNNNVTEPICETQPATIKQNDDPDGFGRVKVLFYWQEGNAAPTPWIRATTPHGGKDRGIYFPPEVGDEVLVAFEGNNPDKPVVVGHLYHGKANQGDRKDKDNYVKTIRTVSGNEIKFTDKSGEEEILIINKNNDNQISLSLKGDGKITIKSKGTLEMKAKEITIEAEKDLSIKGMNIAAESQQKMSMKGTQALELSGAQISAKGDAKLELKAAKVSVAADATLDMEGAMTSVKGKGMASIESNGQTAVKGTIVMIN